MRTKMLLVVTAVLFALAATGAPAEPMKIDIPFGATIVRDTSCPDATHALYSICGGSAQAYLVSAKNNPPDLTRFENQNVGLRMTPLYSTCSLPLYEVEKVKQSDIFPPCPSPTMP